MDRKLVFLLSLVAVLAIGGTALAETPAASQTETDEEGYVAVPFAGMQVFVDKETGRMRPPTALEAQMLAAAMKKRFAHYRPSQHFRYKNGNQSAVLGTDYLRFSVLEIGADGELETSCVKGPDQAHELVATQIHDGPATE